MVRRVQGLCDALGDPCKVDGVFGPATEAAVKAFQANHQLTANGVVDRDTWVSLLAAQEPLPVLAEGAKDTREPWMVRRVQGLATALGEPCAIDGAFGPGTAAAVKAYQHNHAVADDGIVGPATWSALIIGHAA
jgi:peptidoglycan hydrolase-like protein with peptidoglycan-binding domain